MYQIRTLLVLGKLLFAWDPFSKYIRFERYPVDDHMGMCLCLWRLRVAWNVILERLPE